MSPDKMVMMANQIATFFKSQPSDDRAGLVAAHINDFWAPPMRAQLAAHVEAGGDGLDPLVVDAVDAIRVPAS